ncbi:MAG: ferric enterobactin receptor [Saprospiraceae bacterium]|jgi:ferric enterobactin receptor
MLFFGMYAFTMSGQKAPERMEFSDFVLWIGEKHKVKVSFADNPSSFPKIRMDTTTSLNGCLSYLEEEGDIEFFINDKSELFIRKVEIESQDDQYFAIQFIIRDTDTKEPIELVAVSIPGTIYGAYSDIEGKVLLTIPKPLISNSMAISMIGYKALDIPLSTGVLEYEIALDKEAIDFEDILIEDRRDIITSSKYGRNLIVSQSSILSPSSLFGDDILRQMQLLPGVTAHREDQAGISIRGSEAEQTLILLDDIPIYNASHYFGIFGAINPLYVDEAKLYKNNLPITYGEKNGGLLQIQSKSPQDISKTSVSGDLNMLTSSLAVIGRIHKDWTYNLAGRSSYKNVSNTVFSSLAEDTPNMSPPQNFVDNRTPQFNNSIPDFRFYDINASIKYAPSKRTKIAAHAYTSSDDLSNRFVNDIEVQRQQRPVKLSGISLQEENWSNRGLSIRAEHLLKSDGKLNSELYFSNYSMNDLNSITLEQDRNNGRELFNQKSETYNSIREMGFRNYVTLDISNKITLQNGMDLRGYRSVLESDDIISRRLNINTSAIAFSLFSNIEYDLGSQWQLNAGLRGTYYESTEKIYWSPRLDISKRIDKSFLIKGSVGQQYQLSNILSFENLYSRNLEVWTISNGRQIPVSDMKHVMIGGKWKKNRWLVDLEFYHRSTRGLTEVASNNLQLSGDGGVPELKQDTYNLYQGEGTTNGMDFLLSYTGKSGSTSLSYTLSKATQQFPQINQGKAFPSYLDSRHQLQWSNTRRIKKWSLGVNLIYATGRTYTDLNKIGNENTREMINPVNRLSRLPDYFRIDAGVGYGLKIGNVNSAISASLINLLDRQNVSYIQYTFSLPNQNNDSQRGTVVGNASNLLNRTLNLSWKFSF